MKCKLRCRVCKTTKRMSTCNDLSRQTEWKKQRTHCHRSRVLEVATKPLKPQNWSFTKCIFNQMIGSLRFEFDAHWIQPDWRKVCCFTITLLMPLTDSWTPFSFPQFFSFSHNIQHPTQKQRMTIRPNGMSKCCTSLYKSSQWRFTLGSPASNLLQWKQLKQRDDNC